MARNICHVACAEDEGKRLDALLAERGIYASRSAAARAVSQGRVFVNGNEVSKSHIASSGEAIVCELDEEAHPCELKGEDIALDIRYEDDDMLVLSKQAGLLCHPSADHLDGTLVNALIHHCGINNLCNVQGENDRPGIVHRLDGDTSGLMLAAKTDEAGRRLMEAIRLREVDRRYVCLVHGIIAHDSAMVDAPIARHPTDRTKMAVMDTPRSRDAITSLRVLERFAGGAHDGGYTLVECKLFTGRTHQIRVHMQYAGHPVVGDATYTSGAPRDVRASLGLKRQFLHSSHLACAHPMTGEELVFRDHIPSDLAAALEVVRPRTEGLTVAGEEMADVIS